MRSEGNSTESIASGLTSEHARRLLARFGPNELEHKQVSRWRILSRQAQGSISWLLAVAALLSFALGQGVEASTMAVILVLNVLTGYAQELHSEESLRRLRVSTARRARVRRDGRVLLLPASQVVPGDVLVLEPGDSVAADGVLCECSGLLIDEADVTGQVEPATKTVADDARPAAEGRVLMGTAVARGSGTARVVATGARAQLSAVTRVANGNDRTPFMRQLDRIAGSLVACCVGLVLIVAASELARGAGLGHVVLVSLSLAVASLPESLGAMVTVALTAVARRLSSQHLLVRRLDAIETLGSTTLICVGKSGTLTTTDLVVKELRGQTHELLDAALATTAQSSTLVDHVQSAIVTAAHAAGIGDVPGDERLEQPFRNGEGACVAARRRGVWYVRGAPEVVLPRCCPAGHAASTATGLDLAAEAATLQDEGLLVVAVARGESLSGALECIGLLGFSERARPETKRSVELAHRAGIRVVMMTGDHEPQARAMAEEVGLLKPGSARGSELVIANATPEQKVGQVRHWQLAGEIVAVTGDRMNDAGAVGEAHIGIAMGNPGSDVTCDAADVILLDDDFSHLLSAMREGRGVFVNLRRSLVYVLAGNLGELAVMLGATTLGWPEPLLPLQLLWINLVTDSLPAFALVLEPPDPEVMNQPPRRPSEPILGTKEWTSIVLVGLLQAALALLVFRAASGGGDLARARALSTSTIVFLEVFWALAQSGRKMSRGSGKHAPLLYVVIGTALFECALALAPMPHRLGGTLHLGAADVVRALLIGLIPFGLVRARLTLRGRSIRRRERLGNVRPSVDLGPSGEPRL